MRSEEARETHEDEAAGRASEREEGEIRVSDNVADGHDCDGFIFYIY